MGRGQLEGDDLPTDVVRAPKSQEPPTRERWFVRLHISI